MQTLSDPRKRRMTSRHRKRRREAAAHQRKVRKELRKRRREEVRKSYEQERARLLHARTFKMPPAIPKHLRHIIRERQVEARKGWRGLLGKLASVFTKKARL